MELKCISCGIKIEVSLGRPPVDIEQYYELEKFLFYNGNKSICPSCRKLGITLESYGIKEEIKVEVI